MKKQKIGFWKVSDSYGEFSNWYICKFTYKGINFISSEQALMYYKACLFNDSKTASSILDETNQSVIKALGRKVANYDDYTWSKYRYNIMVDILKAKFSQDKKLKNLLLNTKDSLIYEASPLDNIWGIGSTDVNIVKGENLLGKALMEVREFITDKECYMKIPTTNDIMNIWEKLMAQDPRVSKFSKEKLKNSMIVELFLGNALTKVLYPDFNITENSQKIEERVGNIFSKIIIYNCPLIPNNDCQHGFRKIDTKGNEWRKIFEPYFDSLKMIYLRRTLIV